MHAGVFEQIYFSFYESTLALYRGQYAMFGNAEVMPVKVIWDYAYYWGILCQFFFQHRLADLAVAVASEARAGGRAEAEPARAGTAAAGPRRETARNPAHSSTRRACHGSPS